MKEKDYTKDDKGIMKMRELLNDVPGTVMMATDLEKIPFSVCPMTLQQMDEQGDLWIFADRDSDHFKDIERDNRVQLMYFDESNQKYVSLFGNATHIVDAHKVDELWNDGLNEWFDGKKDPNLVLLNINIENAYYWDNGVKKTVSLFGHKTRAEKGHIDLQNH
jgi:general stress protein 26